MGGCQDFGPGSHVVPANWVSMRAKYEVLELHYSSEHLLWVCIAETTFERPSDGCAEGGEKDYVIRVLL